MSAADRIRDLYEADPTLRLTARQIAARLGYKLVTVSLQLTNLHHEGFLIRQHDVDHHRGGARRFVYSRPE